MYRSGDRSRCRSVAGGTEDLVHDVGVPYPMVIISAISDHLRVFSRLPRSELLELLLAVLRNKRFRAN
jgi:hypothetical protein